MANTLSKPRESPASDAVKVAGDNPIQSSEKGISIPLRKSKRISRSSNVHRPVSEVEGNAKAHGHKETANNTFYMEQRGMANMEEKGKENIPPCGDGGEESRPGNSVTSLESTSQQDQGQMKRRRLSRTTRVFKLDDQQYEPEGEIASLDSIGGGVDISDPDTINKEDWEEKVPQRLESVNINVRTTGRESKYKQEEMSEYERQRLENIKRNQEMLRFLELPIAPTNKHAILKESEPGDKVKSSAEDLSGLPKRVKIRKAPVKTAPKSVQPVRVSNRLRGLAVVPLEIGEDDSLDRIAPQLERGTSDISQGDSKGNDDSDDESAANLMSGDLFFDQETRERAIRVDGHYKGWLNSAVMERYGFEKSAQEAWEANGGGAFSFKDPLGLNDEASSSRSKSSKRPKYDAKLVAKAMFKKNPNAFFYRHNEPGQEQWTGDWTEEEGELFLRVAREFGCGDKWGLFASHIPHRVGYQCSNYYRQVVLPQGLVFDANYEYTSRGKPIYCGKYNQRRN